MIASVASPQLAHVNIDVEVDVADAGLRGAMGSAGIPTAIARASILDAGEFQTSPLRQLAAAFAAELPAQHNLFAVLVGADDVRAQFATAALLAANDLLLGEDGIAKQGIIRAGHSVWLLACPAIGSEPGDDP